MFAVLLGVPVVRQLHLHAAHVHADAAAGDGCGLHHARAGLAERITEGNVVAKHVDSGTKYQPYF